MLDALAKNRVQMIGAWSGFVYLALLFLGWGVVAGFLPPRSPSTSAAAVGELFATDYTRIRIGMVIVMFGALAFIPFAALLTQFVARVEGGAGILTYTMALGGVANMVLSFYPAMWWLAVAFRPDRDPELINLVNDMAWLQLIGGVTIFLAIPLTLAVVAFLDKSAEPVFPRWVGYAMVWIVLTTVPDQLMFFFRQGPFSWNGIFGLWIPVLAFGALFIISFICVRKAILRDRAHLVDARASDAAVLAG